MHYCIIVIVSYYMFTLKVKGVQSEYSITFFSFNRIVIQ